MHIPKIDIHLHPFLKAYGHSHYPNNNPENASNPSSPWMVDANTTKDDVVENLLGFPTYRQSDLTSAKQSDVRLLINSLYPLERGFFQFKDNVLGLALDKLAGKAIQEMVTAIGKRYVEKVRSNSFNYLIDLQDQMKFMQRLEGKPTPFGTFKLLNNGQNLENDLSTSPDLLVVNSIEGIQCLCNGNDTESAAGWDQIETTIANLKKEHGRPFFITLAHHFYNGMCSHSESLFSIRTFIKGQSRGMNSLVAQGLANREINDLGRKTINHLLDTANGQRILVDVKHMSKDARKEYYEIRNADFSGIPIVYSHGATQQYYQQNINLTDEDIAAIGKSGGLIGLELDQRVLGYNDEGSRFLRWARNGLRNDRNQNRHWAEIFALNLIHIAEVCSKNNLDPWAHICIGSDYDGIINPLNEFRTINQLGDLCTTTAELLNDYSKQSDWKIDHDSSLSMEDVMYKVGFKNACQFVEKWFN